MGLTYDGGDAKDTRLHLDKFTYNWTRPTEVLYKEVEKQISDFIIDRDAYWINTWCDVSGFDYWVNSMREDNYIQITVTFKNRAVPVDCLEQLAKDLATANAFASQLTVYY